MILQVIIAMVAGWTNRHPQQVIAYQQEEIFILKAKLRKRRRRFTDTERRRLAMLAHPLSRKCLKATATTIGRQRNAASEAWYTEGGNWAKSAECCYSRQLMID